MNIYNQITEVLTIEGTLKCSLSRLKSMELHPIAEKVIDESLHGDELIFSDTDFITCISQLNDANDDIIDYISQLGICCSNRFDVTKELIPFAERCARKGHIHLNTIFTKKTYVPLAYPINKLLHKTSTVLKYVKNIPDKDYETLIRRCNDGDWLCKIAKILSDKGISNKYTIYKDDKLCILKKEGLYQCDGQVFHISVVKENKTEKALRDYLNKNKHSGGFGARYLGDPWWDL